MEKYIAVAITKDETYLYLSDLDMINFSYNIREAIEFKSINSAKDTLADRYLSLSNWIFNITKTEELIGIYILTMNDSDTILRREQYL